jgi:hypothetical protein
VSIYLQLFVDLRLILAAIEVQSRELWPVLEGQTAGCLVSADHVEVEAVSRVILLLQTTCFPFNFFPYQLIILLFQLAEFGLAGWVSGDDLIEFLPDFEAVLVIDEIVDDATVN